MSKILIVEDNEMNRDMVSRRLMRKGFEIVMAEDGQKGVDMSKSENPDLILMDLSLPVMDGWEATSTIKGDPETNSIHIIVLTDHEIEGDRVPNKIVKYIIEEGFCDTWLRNAMGIKVYIYRQKEC